MAEWKVTHRRAELDVFGKPGERRTEHQTRRDILGNIRQVLAAIAFAVAQFVGENESFTVLAQRLGIIPPRRMDRHDEKAELHVFLLLRFALIISAACRSEPVWRAR